MKRPLCNGKICILSGDLFTFELIVKKGGMKWDKGRGRGAIKGEKNQPRNVDWFLYVRTIYYLNRSALMVTLPPLDCHSLVI